MPLADRIRIHTNAHTRWELAFCEARHAVSAEAPGSAPWFAAREEERQVGKWAEELWQELQAMRCAEMAGVEV